MDLMCIKSLAKGVFPRDFSVRVTPNPTFQAFFLGSKSFLKMFPPPPPPTLSPQSLPSPSHVLLEISSILLLYSIRFFFFLFPFFSFFFPNTQALQLGKGCQSRSPIIQLMSNTCLRMKPRLKCS